MRDNQKDETPALTANLGPVRWGVMIFLAFGALPGCGGSVDPADITSIGMKRSGCYGTCPSYEVRIHPDGRVEYTGRDHVAQAGNQVSTVNPEAFADLVPALEAMKFFGLRKEYTKMADCPAWFTDAPSVTFDITHKGGEKQVSYYYGCVGLPVAEQLGDLAELIDTAAKTSQWVGPGPHRQYGSTRMK